MEECQSIIFKKSHEEQIKSEKRKTNHNKDHIEVQEPDEEQDEGPKKCKSEKCQFVKNENKSYLAEKLKKFHLYCCESCCHSIGEEHGEMCAQKKSQTIEEDESQKCKSPNCEFRKNEDEDYLKIKHRKWH